MLQRVQRQEFPLSPTLVLTRAIPRTHENSISPSYLPASGNGRQILRQCARQGTMERLRAYGPVSLVWQHRAINRIRRPTGLLEW